MNTKITLTLGCIQKKTIFQSIPKSEYIQEHSGIAIPSECQLNDYSEFGMWDRVNIKH